MWEEVNGLMNGKERSTIHETEIEENKWVWKRPCRRINTYFTTTVECCGESGLKEHVIFGTQRILKNSFIVDPTKRI